MSLNPPLDFNGNPLRVQHEYFIMKRTDMKYILSFENSSAKYQGNGSVILTTCRIIIVNSKRIDSLKAYEFPLSMILNEKYCQPLMGTNYLAGDCFPMFGNNLGKVNFTLTFTHSCGTFVTGLFMLIDSLRAHNNKGHDKTITEAIRNNTFNSVFPVDKNDPSDFIYEQPDEIPALKPVSQSVVQNDGHLIKGLMNEAGMSVINQNPIQVGQNANNNNNGFEYKLPQQYEYKSVQYNVGGNQQKNNSNSNQSNWVNPYLPKHIIEQNSKVFPSIKENIIEENEQIPQMSMIYPQPQYYQKPNQIHPPQINQPQFNQYDPYPSFDNNQYNLPQYKKDNYFQQNYKDPLIDK